MSEEEVKIIIDIVKVVPAHRLDEMMDSVFDRTNLDEDEEEKLREIFKRIKSIKE